MKPKATSEPGRAVRTRVGRAGLIAALATVMATVAGCPDPEIRYVPSCYDRDGAIRPDAGVDAGPDAGPDAAFARLTLLHTTDMHAHASGYSRFNDYTPLDTTDGDLITGGYARLGGLIKSIRTEQAASGIPVLVFDNGDFTMGTVYDMTLDDPVTFRYFQYMQFDAVNLGNHEFDYSPEGLALIVGNAVDHGFRVPLLASNMVTDDSPEATGDDGVEQLIADGVIVNKMIYDLPNGLRVGVLGMLGPGAVTAAPLSSPITFNTDYGFIQGLVDELRDQDGVHMVAILSHGGINPNGSGDDTMMAAMVDGIDVIMSGHYHTITPQPFRINGALIYIPGEYGQLLPRLDLRYNMTYGGIEDYQFTMYEIDDSITGDASVQAIVEAADATLNDLLMSNLGIALDTPMVEIDFDLERADYAESGLCNMAADGIRRASTMFAVMAGEASPIYDVAAFPAGSARDGLYETTAGYASFADIYNVVPLGVSPDPDNQTVLGWPLVSIWLTPAEIKAMAEVSVSVARAFGLTDLFICFSGMRIDYDPSGTTIPPDRVRAIHMCGNALPVGWGGDGDTFSTNCTTELDISDELTLMHVVTDLYSVLFIREVAQAGLDIEPKYADGTPIIGTDMMDIMNARIDVDMDPNNGMVTEYKPWMALLGIMIDPDVFPDTGGDPSLGNIPEAVYGPNGIAMGRFNAL